MLRVGVFLPSSGVSECFGFVRYVVVWWLSSRSGETIADSTGEEVQLRLIVRNFIVLVIRKVDVVKDARGCMNKLTDQLLERSSDVLRLGTTVVVAGAGMLRMQGNWLVFLSKECKVASEGDARCAVQA